jgi:hypothetical protein
MVCHGIPMQGDNRHSVPVWERVRECSKICSMTLPDGSCSSVTLRPGATIREVLRDLCQSLRINMAAVDLFLVGGEKVSQTHDGSQHSYCFPYCASQCGCRAGVLKPFQPGTQMRNSVFFLGPKLRKICNYI